MEILLPYTDVELTQEVNRIPNTFGLLNALNLFPNEPKASKYVRIEFKDGVVYVLGAEPRGSSGDLGEDDTGNGIILEIPHFPHIDFIGPDDADNMLVIVNGQVEPESMNRQLAQKLAKIRTKHSITREYIRLGALRGLIKDGKGRTLYDIYDVFSITKKTVDFVLGTAGTDIIAKCEEVRDHIQNNLKSETSTGIEAIVDPTWFGKFIQHEKVEKYWLNAQNTAVHSIVSRQQLGGNWGRVFEFQNILWREYKGSLPVKNSSGAITSEANMAANKGNAYPTGTMSMFRTFDGPAFHMSQVNSAPMGAEPIFITTEELKHGAGVEMKSQSNVLAVCKQPECVVEVSSSN